MQPLMTPTSSPPTTPTKVPAKLPEAPRVKAIGYGISGVGKTTFIGTMPGPRYIFNFEANNLMPLEVKGIPFDSDLYTDFGLVQRKVMQLIKECPYKTVVVDGGGTLYALTLKACSTKDTPSLPERGLANERFKMLIRDFQKINAHIYITFHEGMDKDEVLGGVIKGQLLLPGKQMPEEIPPLFNQIWHFTLKPEEGQKPKRQIVTVPQRVMPANDKALWPACDKSGTLDPIEEPDFNKMWPKIEKVFLANQLINNNK